MLEPRKIFGGIGNRMFQGAYLYSQVKKGLIPDIYVQDFSYFEPYKEEIRQLYQQGIPPKKDLVAVHVRRGDYVNNSFYVDLTKTDYYDRALKEFPNEKFLLFCADRQGTNDLKDRQWVIDWLESKGVPFEVFRGDTEVDDMNAMSSCKGIIGANSTFSLWSAFINPYKGKIIMPKAYYSDGVERTKYPNEGWILL